MRKRKLLLTLILFTLLCCTPFFTYAEDDAIMSGLCGDNVRYALYSDGRFELTGSGAMTNYADYSRIPWNGNRDDIKNISIENGVTNICSWAFVSCHNLESVDIPDSVASIGKESFRSCEKLKQLDLPYNLQSTGESAFSECAGLTSIVVPPANFGRWAFNGCTRLEKATILDGAKSLTEGMFSDCTNLTEVIIPNGVAEIEKTALSGCISLEKVDIPDTVQGFGWGAFAGSGIRSIIIPDGVDAISEWLFNECDHLLYITLPDSIKKIYSRAFCECNSLMDVYYAGDESQWNEIVIDNTWNGEGTGYNQPIIDVRVHYNSGDPGSGDADESELIHLIQKSDSTTYSPELAFELMKAAYHAYELRLHVKDYLDNYIKLDWSETYNYYKDPKDPRYKDDSVAYSIGYKDTDDAKIVTVFIRGSYGDFKIKDLPSDWKSNLHLDETLEGAAGWHPGFEKASDEVYDKLDELGLIQTSGIKYVITGHSRGAGVGNLLAVRLSDAKVPKENVFDYNFACPDVNRGWPWDWGGDDKHANIFNIGHCADPVTLIPGIVGDSLLHGERLGMAVGIGWGKYGRSFWYTKDWEEIPMYSTEYHDQSRYVRDMSELWPLDYYKSWVEVKAKAVENGVKDFWSGVLSIFSCPVDVVAKDENGNVLASVINNEISYSETNNGSVLVITYGESKWFFARSDVKVHYEITGTDTGSMEYECYAIDRLNDKEEEILVCSNITLEEGKEFVTDKSRLYVVDENDNKISEVQGDGAEKPVASGEDPCAEGHIFSEWTVTKAATELAAGQKTRSCSVCGKTETATIAQQKPTLPAVKISKVTAGKKSATVKWKKVTTKNHKRIKKIEIQYSTDKTFTTGVKTKYANAKKTSLTIKKLKSKKTYYFRIRAYTKSGSIVHVSKWSTMKKVKAK